MKELRYIPLGLVVAAACFGTAAVAQETDATTPTTPPTTAPFGPTYGPTGPTYPGMPPGYPGPNYPGAPGGPTYVPPQTMPGGALQQQGPAGRLRTGSRAEGGSEGGGDRETKRRAAATKRGETEDEGGGRGDTGAAGSGAAEFETGIEYRRPTGRFSLNLEDADLPDLVRLISSITGKRFIYGGKVRSVKASIFAPTKVTADEAYRAFLSMLEINQLTVVPSGRYLKIVDSADSRQSPLPLYRDGEPAPSEDRMITRLHRLTFTSAENVSEVLGRFKSQNGDITAYAPTNTLIITDSASNIRRMLGIVGELDVQGTGEQVWVEPVHYVAASDLAEKLLEIFEATAGATESRKSRGSSTTRRPAKAGAAGTATEPATVGESTQVSRLSKIIPDDRTNSLIIVATQPAYLRILELIRRLDVPESEGGGDIHVHMLQHADAEELSGVLQQLQSGRRSSSTKRGASAGESAASPAAQGEAFEGDVRISADKATNSLVIVSSLRDYAALRQVVERLDVARRQVFVEAVVMEVSMSRIRRLGLALHGGTTVDTGGEQSLFLAGTAYPQEGGIPFSSIILDPASLTGLAVGLRGPELEGSEDIIAPGISIPAFGVALQALQTDNDVNVLSTPNLLATDNTPAEISVGQNVPVQQGILGGGLGALAGAAGAAGAQGALGALGALGGLGGAAVGRQNVGLTLKMTPHVNDSDEVRLEMDLEVSEVLDRGNINPTISQRMAKTMLTVRDQQTVVLGGLIRDTEGEHQDKVPILGDIPILGFFFRRTVTTVEKTNLLIILTPYIIRDAADFRRIFQQKMEERREFIERYSALTARDPDITIDYSRTNGVVEEVNRALRDAEEEAAILHELDSRPPAEHAPSEPVSVPPEMTGGGGEEEGGGDEPTGEAPPIEGTIPSPLMPGTQVPIDQPEGPQ